MAAVLPALIAAPAYAIDDHALLCEAVVTPTAGEFIEIANPTAAAIDLTDYYLSDDEDYAVLPAGTQSISSSDFIAQFPPGATLPLAGVAVIAFDGAGFISTYGFAADYEIKGTDADTPDMLATDVGGSAGLTNSGENAVLFTWDGESDLVSDVDMVNIGTPSSTNDIGDKTGLSVDGPDADATASTYAADSATMPQQAGDPGFGTSTKRIAPETGKETTGAGNGITLDDETSENITDTWDSPAFSAPNPGTCEVVFSIDCGPGISTTEGTAAGTTVTAVDPSGVVTDMALVSDNVTPGVNVTEGVESLPGGVGVAASLGIDLDDMADTGTFSATVSATSSSGATISCELPIQVTAAFTPIHDIQGDGAASPLDGSTVITGGVVVGDFQDSDQLNGFFIQTPDGSDDSDPNTSEGIFVFEGESVVDVAIGDLVAVEGMVDEFFGLTEITTPVTVTNLGPSVTPATATQVALPFDPGEEETLEGMLVEFSDAVYVTDTFNLGRFGEVVISQGGPLEIPTNNNAPGAAAVAAQAANNDNQIILDDGSSSSFFADPPVHVAPDRTLRRGDTTTGLMGVMDFAFGSYRIQPTEAFEFTRANPRENPEFLGGDVRVASFNLLNFWTTFDDGSNNARGADSQAEFDRQVPKTVAAILELDAAVVALQELENNGPTAIGALVDGLNAATAPSTWAAVPDPAYPGGLENTNAIKVGIIYQTALATPIGGPVADDDPVFATDRPPVAQTFDLSGEVVTVISNHFKSKSPSGATGDDIDQGDGQGAYNFRRTNQALALIDFVAEMQALSGDDDVFAIGDLNSYRLEDPITALNGAMTNLVEEFIDPADQYSLVFFGQQGLLDYAFSTGGITDRVTGVDIWHGHTDEPRALDYNDGTQDAGESSASNINPASLYLPDQWRASDHDAVIVAFRLPTPFEKKEMAIADLQALLPTGNKKDDKRIEKALESIEDSLNPAFWADGAHLTEQGYKVFNEEKKAVKDLLKVKGAAAPAAQAVVDALVAVDEELAQNAIDIAIAVGGKQNKIDKALSEMAKAAGELAKGKPEKAIDKYKHAWQFATKAVKDARFATFNASLNRSSAGALAAELAVPGSAQPAAVAEIIQRTRPEVLLINEFDYDPSGAAGALFQQNYLSVSQNGADPIDYPFRYAAPSNTGIFSGFDLDNDGNTGGPVGSFNYADDSFGFGQFPGQYGMIVYSMYPIDLDNVRTFQNFLWKDMPGALLPEDPPGTPWYSPAELDVFRLSSKSHWDLPLIVGDETVHFLTSHPTPPVFDGPEDANGTRNHDEIRFWADYVEGGSTASYIYDDNLVFGGLASDAKFVIAGDQNSDPNDGDSIPGAIQQLLDSPKVNTKVTPASPGGPEQSLLQGGANASHLSNPAFDTADFSDSAPGNLRADYVLPRKNMKILDAAVFWPETSDPLFPLVGTFPFPSSDHRLVWIEVKTG